MNERNDDLPQEDGQWEAGQNEYAQLGQEEQPEIVRTGRTLEMYKDVFGDDFGKGEEVILDVGAGDSTTADEIEALTDHRATVVRFDRDYDPEHGVAPDGSAPAIAGDATSMPFADESFDRIVSHNVMYYLGREKGNEVISEMLRVLKPGGEAAIFQAKPLTPVGTEIGQKERYSATFFPTLVITKPEGFDDWDDARKSSTYGELTKAVTFGKLGTSLIQLRTARQIKHHGTHRSIEW